MLLAVGCLAAACSKKSDDNVTPPPSSKETTVAVENTTSYGYAIDSLYIAAFKATNIDDINKDQSPDSRKIYALGPLPKGKTSTKLTIDARFKSYIVLYKNYNSILKRYLVTQIMSLGDGTSTNPYVFKSGEAKTIVLDDKTKTKFIY